LNYQEHYRREKGVIGMAEFNLLNAIFLLFLGFCCGILSGFFGVGGAFILTPLLNILGLPMVNAVATGMSFTVISSMYGGIKHLIAKNILVKISLVVGLISLIGVHISQPLVIHLDKLNIADRYIGLVFIILLIFLGTTLVLKNNKTKNGTIGIKKELFEKLNKLPPCIKVDRDKKISIWCLLIIGLFVGFLQGFLGVGGGFILVPIFLIVLNLNAHKAVGTSLLTIFISAIYGSYLYIMSGKVIFYILIFLGLSTILGINIGVKAIKNITSDKLRIFYSIFLLLVSLGIALKQFNLVNISLFYTIGLVIAVTVFIILVYYLKIVDTKFKKMSAQLK
jgi:uncharacterized membrane protein YfcA